nr:bladder cancer associated transcript 1 isoform X1 [Anser cygnoides]
MMKGARGRSVFFFLPSVNWRARNRFVRACALPNSIESRKKKEPGVSALGRDQCSDETAPEKSFLRLGTCSSNGSAGIRQGGERWVFCDEVSSGAPTPLLLRVMPQFTFACFCGLHGFCKMKRKKEESSAEQETAV